MACPGTKPGKKLKQDHIMILDSNFTLDLFQNQDVKKLYQLQKNWHPIKILVMGKNQEHHYSMNVLSLDGMHLELMKFASAIVIVVC